MAVAACYLINLFRPLLKISRLPALGPPRAQVRFSLPLLCQWHFFDVKARWLLINAALTSFQGRMLRVSFDERLHYGHIYKQAM